MTPSPGVVRTMVAAVAACAALLALPERREPRPTRGAEGRLELGAAPDASGFARVGAPRPFRFPADHGPHPEFQTEWWYFTGQLATREGRRFGFQLTFFRRGLAPGPPPERGLLAKQVYLAHFAITDVAARHHQAVERAARGAGGLAGASGEPFSVWLEDWRAESAPVAASEGGVRWLLHATDQAAAMRLDLELRNEKPLVVHGLSGVSAKGREPGNASHYVGYTRLSARGTVARGDDAAAVSGQAWFDHEWSTSALGPGAVGWDWFSLQLDDGRELMFFRIRREDGSLEPVSAGTLVDAAGRARRLALEEVRLRPVGRWTSPQSGATYPAAWRLDVPSEGLELRVFPLVADQELRTSFVYWEGAVGVAGRARGRQVEGRGYVELTGYARSMQGVF